MRLWSLHPKYLDTRGLVALWREGLLALAVVQGRTRGYRTHPQLVRFRNHPKPVAAVNEYLHHVLREGQRRGYRFDESKLMRSALVGSITVTAGQLGYEFHHLLGKLKQRAPSRFDHLSRVAEPEAHPLFTVVPGPIEDWEKA